MSVHRKRVFTHTHICALYVLCTVHVFANLDQEMNANRMRRWRTEFYVDCGSFTSPSPLSRTFLFLSISSWWWARRMASVYMGKSTKPLLFGCLHPPFLNGIRNKRNFLHNHNFTFTLTDNYGPCTWSSVMQYTVFNRHVLLHVRQVFVLQRVLHSQWN